MKWTFKSISGKNRFETKKYIIFINAYSKGFEKAPIRYFFKTPSHVKEVFIQRKSFFRKNPTIKMNPKLFFIRIPCLDDLATCHKFLSDKKIDYQINQLLKLRAFI